MRYAAEKSVCRVIQRSLLADRKAQTAIHTKPVIKNNLHYENIRNFVYE